MDEYDKSGAYGERGSKPQNDIEQSEKRRNTKAKAIWAALICIFGLALIIGGAAVRSGPLWGAGSLALVPAVILALLIVRDALEMCTVPLSPIPYGAWGCYLLCAALGFAAFGIGDFFPGIGLILLLAAIFAPIAGIVLAIYSITLGKYVTGKSGLGVGIAALIFPFAAIGIFILLLSTHAIVIVLM